MPRIKPEQDLEEVWESQVPGRTFAQLRDVDGRIRMTSCVGTGSRMRLMTSDRIRMQERIRLDRMDPFRNGTLVRIDANQQDDPDTQSGDALGEADLTACFELQIDDFRDYVSELSEVNVRRLKALAEAKSASVNQDRFLTELIAERYAVGGDTPTNRAMRSGPSMPA